MGNEDGKACRKQKGKPRDITAARYVTRLPFLFNVRPERPSGSPIEDGFIAFCTQSPRICAIGNRVKSTLVQASGGFQEIRLWHIPCKKTTPMNEASNFAGQATRLEKPLHDQIAAVAYQLYVENGRQDGRDWEYWFRAEELLGQQAARPARDQGIQPNRPQEIRPLDPREYPFARDKRGSANREEIRQRAHVHPAARQSQRQPARSSQAR